MIKNLVDELAIVNDPLWDVAGLKQFERKMADHWEAGKVRGPIHLSGGNEAELIVGTHRTSEKSINATIKKLNGLDVVRNVDSEIRVEG